MTLQFLTLGHYPREMKTYASKNKTSTKIFIAALFVIAPNWKQPRCPSVGEQLNTEYDPNWYIYLTEFHLIMKRKDRLLIQATT